MIRNRTFMMGLGAGLVLGALLFQLMLIGERSMNPPSQQKLSKEEVVKAAESLNLKVVDESAELMTKEQWEENVKNGKDEQKGTKPKTPSAPDAGAKPGQPDKPKSPKDTKTSAGSPETRAPEDPEKPAPAEVAHIIKRGTLADVAEDLEQAGIIESRDAFLKAANAKGINRIVQRGTYHFAPGESLDSIIGKISSKLPQ